MDLNNETFNTLLSESADELIMRAKIAERRRMWETLVEEGGLCTLSPSEVYAHGFEDGWKAAKDDR
jgi:hypothetical protein